jgi:hypothetical protein
MSRDKRAYRSYLLRLWQVRGEKALWRASLESPLTGECYGFANLRALYEYIEEQADSSMQPRQPADDLPAKTTPID